MDCVSCREVIQRYIDGELDDGQVVEFQRHLSFCGDCAAELQGIAAARAVLHATREVTVDVPAGFADRVMTALEAQPEPSGFERALSSRDRRRAARSRAPSHPSLRLLRSGRWPPWSSACSASTATSPARAR